MQLEPREIFPIVRQIEDPSDSATYYIRAVIRNAKTKEVLDTVNLVDDGDRHFSYNWQTPEDPGGVGMYIEILTSVYTDDGYTTKSESYGEKSDVYLLLTRGLPYFGSGGTSVDYARISSMVKEVVQAEIKGMPNPEKPDKIDLSSLSSLVEEAIQKIDDISIPIPEKIDLKPVLSLVSEAISEIKAINIPEPEKLDLTPVIKKLDGLSRDAMEKKLNDILDRIKQYFDGDMVKLSGFFSEIIKRLDNTPMLVAYNKPAESKKEEVDGGKSFKLFKKR